MNSKEQVDKMVGNLRKGKDIHEMFTNTIRTTILIQGKTIEQWKSHFAIKISDNPDVVECKTIDKRLVELHEEASFLKSMAEAALALGKKGFDTQYREKFTELVSEYKTGDKKLPAKDTLETLVSHQLDDIQTSMTFSEVAVTFWKDVLSDLNYKRRAIENITINNSVEAKSNLASNMLQNRRDQNE